MATNDDDSELIRRFNEHDHDARIEIYQRCRPVMTAAAQKVFRSADSSFSGNQVDDVVMEVFGRFMARGLPGDCSSIEGYATRSATNFAITQWNRRNTLIEGAEDIEDADDASVTLDLEDPAVHLELREEELHRDALKDAVTRHIDDLPAQHRRVIKAVYFDHKKQKDVANEMQVTPARVSQLNSEGLAKLRVALAPLLQSADVQQTAK